MDSIYQALYIISIVTKDIFSIDMINLDIFIEMIFYYNIRYFPIDRFISLYREIDITHSKHIKVEARKY